MYTFQTISFDFAVHGVTPRVVGKQGDTNRLVSVYLYDHGNYVEIPENSHLSINFRTPSGKSGSYDRLPDGSQAYSFHGNEIVISLAPQIFVETGVASCDITIVDPHGSVSTWTFFVSVEASVLNGTPVPEDYYNSFMSIVANAAADAARASDAADRAEEAAASASGIKMQTGSYVGDGNVNRYRSISPGFNWFIIGIREKTQKSPTVVFFNGMTANSYQPVSGYCRSVEISCTSGSNYLQFRAFGAWEATTYGGSMVSSEATAEDGLNKSGITYEWFAIGR
jgi:hypothetical protein